MTQSDSQSSSCVSVIEKGQRLQRQVNKSSLFLPQQWGVNRVITSRSHPTNSQGMRYLQGLKDLKPWSSTGNVRAERGTVTQLQGEKATAVRRKYSSVERNSRGQEVRMKWLRWNISFHFDHKEHINTFIPRNSTTKITHMLVFKKMLKKSHSLFFKGKILF